MRVCHLFESQNAEARSLTGRDGKVGAEDYSMLAGRRARRIEADVIVSHLPISWVWFPFLVQLRALNPDTRIVHAQTWAGAGRPRNRRLPGRGVKLLTYSLFDEIRLDPRVSART